MKSVGNGELELADDELPLKSDFVVWIELTDYQKEFYNSILSKQKVKQIINEGEYYYSAFQYLCFIKKLCQHPLLLWKQKKQK